MFCKDLAHVLQGAESMFLQALSMMLHENGAKMRENTWSQSQIEKFWLCNSDL